MFHRTKANICLVIRKPRHWIGQGAPRYDGVETEHSISKAIRLLHDKVHRGKLNEIEDV
jgi:hypothetical protein